MNISSHHLEYSAAQGLQCHWNSRLSSLEVERDAASLWCQGKVVEVPVRCTSTPVRKFNAFECVNLLAGRQCTFVEPNTISDLVRHHSRA
jgi:hypothetical protein